MPLAAPFALDQLQQHRMAGTAGLRCHGPNGAYQGRECGNQQPMHVMSSSLHVLHVLHAIGAQQQAACAPMSP